MSAVTVDIRMLKKGTKWCATAHVTAPSLRGPVDLYACQDIRDSLGMIQRALDTVAMPKEFLAKASSAARKRVRREILGLTYNLLSELSTDLKGGASKMQKSLEACDHACDLVFRARGGDAKAKRSIESIFIRAKGGDVDANRSARLILESADLLDDGRAAFRVTMLAPKENEFRPFERRHLALPQATSLQMPSTGAEKSAIFYPGSTVPNAPTYDIPKKDVEKMLQDPWEYTPYPLGDRNGYNIFNVLKPAVAMF